eukprot:maker-scaffold_144-snap-gene-0.6-mRNA-1 protein AED:0.46 eAED:0.48 QI:0/0/0/1/0/0/5/0/183
MCRPSQTPHLPMSSKRLADALIRKQSKLLPLHRISKTTLRVVVFHWRRISHLFYTSYSQAQQVDRDSRNLVNPFMRLDDEAFGYLKRVIVTPAVYPRLIEFLHFDIQSTGQKSHCVIILCLGRLLYLYHPAKRPNLSAATVRKQQTGRCNTFKQRPSHKTSRANPFPEVSDLICRLPLSTLFY